MEVIDLTDGVEEVLVQPDLFDLARQYNFCALIKNKSPMPEADLIDEVGNFSFLDTALEYCGPHNGKYVFAGKTRYRHKYVEDALSALLDTLGPLISYELLALKRLKSNK